jgi:Flp pilus assembly protein TadG
MTFTSATRGRCVRRPSAAEAPELLVRVGRCRRGMAICLPMLSLLVFGSIQACDLIYLKHALTSAAYEGSLEMARPSATNASVLARVQQMLAARQVTSANVSLTPVGLNVATTTPGTTVTITASAITAPNSEALRASSFLLHRSHRPSSAPVRVTSHACRSLLRLAAQSLFSRNRLTCAGESPESTTRTLPTIPPVSAGGDPAAGRLSASGDGDHARLRRRSGLHADHPP